MHYGVEEMFFVLSGTPTLRTGDSKEQLSPESVVYCPEGTGACTCSRTRRIEPVRILGVSTKRVPRASSRIRSGVRLGRDPPSGAPSS